MGGSNSKEFSHKEAYGASFETLKRLCFREWPDSIGTVGDIPPGKRKSAISVFVNENQFKNVEFEIGEITVPVSKE